MSETLSETQRRFLLRLAREAVTVRLADGRILEPETDDPILREMRGAFVTLTQKGELRGCIGYPLPLKPLAEAVAEMAVAAALEDPRFEPVSLEEVADLHFEISVLTLPSPLDDPEQVVVGRHGIIVSRGFHKGLLLPQVPIEYNWDRETFLRHGCLKAGLPPDAWKKGARIEVFEADVFGE
ncbi:MAG: AmmeMemoRadiSam system protein A [Candidatus Aminicenantales bacterium]